MPFVISKIDQKCKIPYRLEVINVLSFSKIITKKTFVAQSSNATKYQQMVLSHRALHDENSKITPKWLD